MIRLLSIALCVVSLSAAAIEPNSDLESLESLGTVEMKAAGRMESDVTSVGKKTQRASETAAALYVITQEDIRRSGVTSIADALRLAPGVQVARIDSNRWAISARGFNGAFANKLLVLTDGREVYSPSFGGVYWDIQDMPLEDIERIEVIRGPGASLWGANAVNGVVNIITKTARDTQGGSLRAGGGSYEQGFGSLRYGAALGDDTYGRAFAKGTRRGNFNLRGGGSADDHWDMVQTGFRLDRDAGEGKALMVEGGAYQTDYNQLVLQPLVVPPYNIYPSRPARASGFNLLGRWRQALSLGSEMSLQGFYDHSYRNEGYLVQERDTLDLEFQHRFLWGERQDVVWGLGYRLLKDNLSLHWDGVVDPGAVNRQLFSAFLQDDIQLMDNALVLTVGAKLQHNDYTGFEGQPSVRLLWTPSPEHSLWAAISRVVRIPARSECCLTAGVYTLPPGTAIIYNPLPVVVSMGANPHFQAERLWAYELGYRFKPLAGVSVDAALFYNDYDKLRNWGYDDIRVSFKDGYFGGVFITHNQATANSYGGEISADWHPFPEWTLQAAYSFLHVNFATNSLVLSPDKGVNPEQQAYLRSGFKPRPDWDVDLWLRYVDRLPLDGFPALPTYASPIPAYLTLDARLAYRPLPGLELSVVGQNLLQPGHVEFAQEAFGPPQTLVPRSFYLQLDWRF